jgi:hypothetical protein
MALKLDDIPFSLHANDIVKHIINIDSRFRVSKEGSSASNFYFRLPTPIRNVLRIRVTSIEFPNNYFVFSAYRRNVTFWVSFGSPAVTASVVIPDGNYSLEALVDTINDLFAGSALSWLTISFNEVAGEFTFTGSQDFSINTVCGSTDTWNREFDYGLGYNLGFSRGIFEAIDISGGTVFAAVSNQSAYFAGDPYVFLRVNDFECVRQTVGGYQFGALAKIIMAQAKDYMNFDDYTGHHAKEVTFPNPYDLTRFKIQLVDPYGQLLEMDSAQISFSLEVLEVRNLSLYNLIRDSFATRWTV